MRLSTALSTLCAITAFAQSTPKPPTLTYLYTLNATLADAITIGPGPRGGRVAIPITGGTFSGPKLKGANEPLSLIPNCASAFGR
jgi:hypothetical protein